MTEQNDKMQTIARITEVHRDMFKVQCEYGEVSAVLKGTFLKDAKENGDYPAVGDFVTLIYNDSGNSLISQLQPRKSKFSRMDNSGGFEQIVAANFDYVFITMSLNKDFNINRLERYLSVAWQSGGIPVIILTKADLCEDYASLVNSVYKIAGMVDVIPISSHTGFGIDHLTEYLKPNKTIVFLGSSGVGKSSLVNALASKEVMSVNDIREDDAKGRHTTTHRQMVTLDSGTFVIDTPGMRELGIWDASEGISETFRDIEELFASCKFGDCSHSKEPGCAVHTALEDGSLAEKRWQNYQKQLKEAAFAENKISAMRKREQAGKDIAKQLKEHYQKHQR